MSESKIEMKKILVVDDEQDMVELVSMRLGSHGYSVVTASDGQEALQAVRTQNPDLVILDIMLPKLDGYKVCRMIKFDVKTKKLPVILFSARSEEKDVAMGSACGADGYIMKPFEPAALLAKIEELLNPEKVS